MIVGIGNDIIAVQRIKEALQRGGEPLKERLFSAQEIGYCEAKKYPERHYAGRFAAKEAILKACGKGLRDGISWCDIDIVNDGYGKPVAHLSGVLAAFLDGLVLHLTISHDQSYASATAILERVS